MDANKPKPTDDKPPNMIGPINEPDPGPDRDEAAAQERVGKLRESVWLVKKPEEQISDVDIELLWHPRLDRRYALLLDPDGSELIIDRIGKKQQEKLDGLHLFTANLVLGDLGFVASPSLQKRIVHVWKVLIHASGPGSIYVRTLEERFARVWDAEFIAEPSGSVSADAMQKALYGQGIKSPREQRLFHAWAERERGLKKRRSNTERWYEGAAGLSERRDKEESEKRAAARKEAEEKAKAEAAKIAKQKEAVFRSDAERNAAADTSKALAGLVAAPTLDTAVAAAKPPPRAPSPVPPSEAKPLTGDSFPAPNPSPVTPRPESVAAMTGDSNGLGNPSSVVEPLNGGESVSEPPTPSAEKPSEPPLGDDLGNNEGKSTGVAMGESTDNTKSEFTGIPTEEAINDDGATAIPMGDADDIPMGKYEPMPIDDLVAQLDEDAQSPPTPSPVPPVEPVREVSP